MMTIIFMMMTRLLSGHDGYQKRKAQEAKIEEEFMRITWHLSRCCDWRMSEDQKKDKNCGSNR